MDSNSSSYFLNHTNFPYYQGNQDGSSSIIDLGLSLRALQPQAYHPSRRDGYGELMDWHQLHPEIKGSKFEYPVNVTEDETGVQSKQRWAYVKVNMDGVIVGRKICIGDHLDYSSLAIQLEEMFGRQTISGLRLFQAGSEFCLFYKDRDEQWRTVGDVPWKEFVDCVNRLRIVHKNEVFVPSSSAAFA